MADHLRCCLARLVQQQAMIERRISAAEYYGDLRAVARLERERADLRREAERLMARRETLLTLGL